MKAALMFSFIILLAALTGCGGGETEKPENKAPAATNLNSAVPTPAAPMANAANIQSNTNGRNSNAHRDDVDRDDRSKAANSNNANRRDSDDSREREGEHDRDRDDK